MFRSAQCALRGDAKNVTAVTMSPGICDGPGAGLQPCGVTNRYVTAVTYLCEPGTIS